MHRYYDAHQGQFPQTSHTDVTQSWIFTLAQFMESCDQMRICPDDAKAAHRRRSSSEQLWSTGRRNLGFRIWGEYRLAMELQL